MAPTKMFTVHLVQWPNGSYGLTETDTVEPIATFEVHTTARSKVATQIIAHLLGHDTTNAVWRR